MKDILGWCNDNNSYFWEYVEKYEDPDIWDYLAERENNSYFWEYVAKYEDPDIWDYLAERWEVMKDSIARGLDHEGVLPGGLNVRRKAYAYYQHAKSYNSSMQRRGLLFAYAARPMPIISTPRATTAPCSGADCCSHTRWPSRRRMPPAVL